MSGETFSASGSEAGRNDQRSGVAHNDSRRPAAPARIAIRSPSVSVCWIRPPSIGAERRADRHLAAAAGRSRQQEVRDVGAGNQQHERDDRHQHTADAGEDAAERRRDELKRNRRRRQVPVGVRIVRREARAEDREIRPRLRGRDAGRETADAEEPMLAPLAEVESGIQYRVQ